jgi:hypothetical protein
MARLKITRASGETIVQITPVVEAAFESNFGSGIQKRFREEERTSDLYWLAHNALMRKEVIPPYGEDFLMTLINVDVLEDELPNG